MPTPSTPARRLRRGFTADALELIRHRYQDTDETQGSIATDFGVSRRTLDTLAKKQGWTLRKDRAPRDLPAAMRLELAAAQALGDAVAVEPPDPDGAAEPSLAPSLALRLEQVVEKELRKVEALRGAFGTPAQRTIEAERIARTLATLTETLFKVRRLREPGAGAADDHDDLPSNADDFRRELARRIDAFVASRLTSAWTNETRLPAQLRLHHDFAVLAHRHQEHGETGNDGGPWTSWLILGGRGAGKTRCGAEWVRAMACGLPPYADRPHGRIALVGETAHDARAVMVEGESGLLRCSPRAQRPEWIATRRQLEWPNGAIGQILSADDPDSFRGPQFAAARCDELAKWRYAEAAFDTLQFALRLGRRPRQLITTTPRPLPLIKRLLADPRTRVTRAPTQVNAAFLAPAGAGAISATSPAASPAPSRPAIRPTRWWIWSTR